MQLRRQVHGARRANNRRAAAFPANFGSLFTGVLQCCQSENLVTSSGGLVSAWGDMSGAAKDYAAAGGARPAVSAGLNGYPGITFDGVDDIMTAATLSLPAPGTTPSWCGVVFRAVTGILGSRIVSDAATDLALVLFTHTVFTNQLRGYNGVQGPPDTYVVGSWICTEIGFQNTAADYLKIGSNAPVNGTVMGNAASVGRTLGGGGALFSNIEVVHVIYTATIQPAAIATWRAACAAKYGASLLT